MSLQFYQDSIRRLNVNTSRGRASPHKLCMLLAVFDLARAGLLVDNRILFGPQLLERYRHFFEAAKSSGDNANPHFPFFHLASKLRGGGDSFWHLRALPGRESVLAALKTVRSPSEVTANIAYAELDDQLFSLMQDPVALDALSDTISTHWLDRGLQDLQQVAIKAREISRYEYRLRQSNPLPAREGPAPPYVRDPAFRRVVTEIYDYRCAATGVRILLPSGEAMVEAAHIHPFAEAGDDDPRNGLALTPNIHWAMDKNLIAPGPDLRWHISAALDDRIPDFHQLTSLKGRELILPKEARYFPKGDVLHWRLDRLKKHGNAGL